MKFQNINKPYLLLIFFAICNCFTTLKPPPITFTQTQTAAEKQMIGQDRELEKNGWLISSIRTSATGSEIWEKEVLEKEIPESAMDEDTKMSYRSLAYLSMELREFKKKGFVGESLSGSVEFNPLWQDTLYKKEFPEKKQRATDLMKLVNEAREKIKQKRFSILESQGLKPEQLTKKKQELVSVYYNMTEFGEYWEKTKGKWEKKQ